LFYVDPCRNPFFQVKESNTVSGNTELLQRSWVVIPFFRSKNQTRYLKLKQMSGGCERRNPFFQVKESNLTTGISMESPSKES